MFFLEKPFFRKKQRSQSYFGEDINGLARALPNGL
jgi:hypothetical protein